MTVQGFSPPLRFAIDAQISPTVPGGTETALLALLQALAGHDRSNDFLILGLKGYHQQLEPFLGPRMSLEPYPMHYRWYQPGEADRHAPGPRWRKAIEAAGPFGGTVRKLNEIYAHGQDLSPRARSIARRAGPAKAIVAIAYRLYHGFRYGPTKRLPASVSDALLTARGAAGVHFPYPLHFDTNLPFVYEPWGLPHRHEREAFRAGEPEWMDALIRHGCTKAAMIITATRWVKDDIVSAYGIDPSRIAVIPRLPDFREQDAAAEHTDPGDLPAQFLLYPAMTWPTKNHLNLVRALARLRDQHGRVLNLVCTGRTDTPHFEIIRAEITALGLDDQVRFLGRISAGRLAALFRRADFLVHASRFEGLGLPIVEAFHHGLPVLASRAACIPEVVGDAGLLFDPNDVEDMASTILRAMTEPGLRERLRERGRARIQSAFVEPQRLAQMFVAVYKKAAGHPLDPNDAATLAEITR